MNQCLMTCTTFGFWPSLKLSVLYVSTCPRGRAQFTGPLKQPKSRLLQVSREEEPVAWHRTFLRISYQPCFRKALLPVSNRHDLRMCALFRDILKTSPGLGR